MDFLHTLVAFVIQGLQLFLQLIVLFLSFLLVLAREVLNLFHLS